MFRVCHAFLSNQCSPLVTCLERALSWFSCVRCFVVFCNFPRVVSWVGCGIWLYRFLIFASLLTLNCNLKVTLLNQNGKWVWSGNTTITHCRPTHGTNAHYSLFECISMRNGLAGLYVQKIQLIAQCIHFKRQTHLMTWHRLIDRCLQLDMCSTLHVKITLQLYEGELSPQKRQRQAMLLFVKYNLTFGILHYLIYLTGCEKVINAL